MPKKSSLPGVDIALGSLAKNGDPFARAPLAPKILEGYTYTHPKLGSTSAAIDDRIIAETGCLYTNDTLLARALQQRGAQVGTYREIQRLLIDTFADERLVWGFSGFASIGPSCVIEVKAMKLLYGSIVGKGENRPSLITDGGSAAGVLGINGALSKRSGMPSTLGVSPLMGISSTGPRTHTLVYGTTYVEREILVGILPDALVCVGGGVGAMRECQATLRHGGRVVLVMLKDDGPETMSGFWQTVPEFLLARQTEQLICCESLSGIPAAIEQARDIVREDISTRISRPDRLWTLSKLLAD